MAIFEIINITYFLKQNITHTHTTNLSNSDSFSTRLISKTKPVTPNVYFISETEVNHYLSVVEN